MGRRNVKNGANKRSALTKLCKEISTIVGAYINTSDGNHPINVVDQTKHLKKERLNSTISNNIHCNKTNHRKRVRLNKNIKKSIVKTLKLSKDEPPQAGQA